MRNNEKTKLLLISAILAGNLSCGKKSSSGESPEQPNDASLNNTDAPPVFNLTDGSDTLEGDISNFLLGQFETGCLATEFGSVKIFDIFKQDQQEFEGYSRPPRFTSDLYTGESFSRRIQFDHSGSNCLQISAELQYFYSLNDYDGSEKTYHAFDIELQLQQVGIWVYSKQLAERFNSNSFCGYTDWSTDSYDVSNLDCDYIFGDGYPFAIPYTQLDTVLNKSLKVSDDGIEWSGTPGEIFLGSEEGDFTELLLKPQVEEKYLSKKSAVPYFGPSKETVKFPVVDSFHSLSEEIRFSYRLINESGNYTDYIWFSDEDRKSDFIEYTSLIYAPNGEYLFHEIGFYKNSGPFLGYASYDDEKQEWTVDREVAAYVPNLKEELDVMGRQAFWKDNPLGLDLEKPSLVEILDSELNEVKVEGTAETQVRLFAKMTDDVSGIRDVDLYISVTEGRSSLSCSFDAKYLGKDIYELVCTTRNGISLAHFKRLMAKEEIELSIVDGVDRRTWVDLKL